jgi:3-oxoacyl-[acyl-carrier protein] reductase
VAITARSLSSLDETAEAIRAAGRRACPLAWDVADVSLAETRLAEAAELLGGLDILVNNAGVIRGDAAHPTPTPEALWDYTMDVNLKGLYFLCQAAAARMKAQGSGIIVNLASDAGMRAAPNPYGISKWGVIGLTKGLAKQLAPFGVRVNAIAPGPVATQMMNWHPGEPIDAPNLPLGRYALPDEIAGVALFLASDDAAAVIGQTIVVNSANT